MIDLGPHAPFIIAAYGIVALVTFGLIVTAFLRNRAIKQKLIRLEREGYVRGDNAPTGTTKA